jgi:hypothetical protein
MCPLLQLRDAPPALAVAVLLFAFASAPLAPPRQRPSRRVTSRAWSTLELAADCTWSAGARAAPVVVLERGDA